MSEAIDRRFKALADEWIAKNIDEIRDEVRDEAQFEKSIKIAKSLLNIGIMPDEQIAESCDLTIQQVRELRKSA